LPADPISGTQSSGHTVYTAELDSVICIAAIPAYAEVEVHIEDSIMTADIRATAYPYVENDSLKITNVLEYNIIPAPRPVITIHDSIPYLVMTPAEVPWIEKPAVVAGGTIGIITILLIIAAAI
jgi:hypothetical protein